MHNLRDTRHAGLMHPEMMTAGECHSLGQTANMLKQLVHTAR